MYYITFLNIFVFGLKNLFRTILSSFYHFLTVTPYIQLYKLLYGSTLSFCITFCFPHFSVQPQISLSFTTSFLSLERHFHSPPPYLSVYLHHSHGLYYSERNSGRGSEKSLCGKQYRCRSDYSLFVYARHTKYHNSRFPRKNSPGVEESE